MTASPFSKKEIVSFFTRNICLLICLLGVAFPLEVSADKDQLPLARGGAINRSSEDILPDLVVTDIQFSSREDGSIVQATAIIENIGDSDAAAFEFRVYLDGVKTCWHTVSGGLPSGQTFVTEGPYGPCEYFASKDVDTVMVCVDTQDQIEESDETNNCYKEASPGHECLRGDVNCDGSITPGDALCTFWRSILGVFQEECDCGCSEEASDVNCDGQITPGDALCIFWRSILGDWQDECRCEP